MADHWISLTKDACLGAAGLVGIYVGLKGLRTWERTLRGESAFETATELLKASYKVQAAFGYVRNPVRRQSDYPDHMRTIIGTLRDDLKAEGERHVQKERWALLNKRFGKLEKVYLSAEVQWGADFLPAMSALRECRDDLFAAVNENIRCIRIHGNSLHVENALFLPIAYDFKDDASGIFTFRIHAIIRQFEERLRPEILGNPLRPRAVNWIVQRFHKTRTGALKGWRFVSRHCSQGWHVFLHGERVPSKASPPRERAGPER